MLPYAPFMPMQRATARASGYAMRLDARMLARAYEARYGGAAEAMLFRCACCLLLRYFLRHAGYMSPRITPPRRYYADTIMRALLRRRERVLTNIRHPRWSSPLAEMLPLMPLSPMPPFDAAAARRCLSPR